MPQYLRQQFHVIQFYGFLFFYHPCLLQRDMLLGCNFFHLLYFSLVRLTRCCCSSFCWIFMSRCHIVRLFVLFWVGISIQTWLFYRPLECSLLTSLGKLCRRNNFIFIWSLILSHVHIVQHSFGRQRAVQQANLL